jgi:hypothetical protein
MYTKDVRSMYLEMRKPWVSPNGLGSAIQMQIFFVNRAGRKLSQERKDAIWESIEYLRIELKHLRYVHGRISFRNDDKVIDFLQNELAFLLLTKQLRLNREPMPVYPPPPSAKRIG